MLSLRNKTMMGWGAVRYRLTGHKFPLNIMLSVTDLCPSRCNYCQIPKRGYPGPATRELLNLIDQAADLGTQRLGLWGGEPLMRPDIGEIIDHAKERGMYVTLDSNGYFLPARIGELTRLDHVVIALDGPEEAHDANREKGSHRKALNAIEAAAGKVQTWTITVLTRNNLTAIPYVLDVAREYGTMTTFQILHHNNILARNKSLLMPSQEAYRKAIRQLLHEKRRGAPIASSTTYLQHLLRWPDYQQVTARDAGDGYRCLAGRLFCNIDSDGALYPCSLLVGEMEAPNVFTGGLQAAWKKLKEAPCDACVAGCFTEYSHLYGLHLPTIRQWMKAMRKSKVKKPSGKR